METVCWLVGLLVGWLIGWAVGLSFSQSVMPDILLSWLGGRVFLQSIWQAVGRSKVSLFSGVRSLMNWPGKMIVDQMFARLVGWYGFNLVSLVGACWI